MEPYEEAERLEAKWDKFVETLPRCTLCRRVLYPGDKFHAACHQIVCPACKEELDENEDMVEMS